MLESRRRTRSLAVLAIPLLCLSGACRDSPTSPTEPLVTTINGLVYDSASRPLSGARVEVTSGADAGKFEVSDATGSFTMSADALASGSVSLQATKEGFATIDQTFPVTSDVTRVTLQLTADVLLDLAGEYTLTIDASGLCTTLPAVAQSRTYQASISSTSNRSSFRIQLRGATFFPDHDSFGVDVATDSARFVLLSPDVEQRPVVEEVFSSDTFVEFSGEGTAPVSANDTVISAAFTGPISYCSARPLTSNFVCPTTPVRCQSSSHRLTFTPN